MGLLCVSFCRIGWVGSGPLGREQPLHLSPAPASRCLALGAIQPPFPVSDCFQIPQPQTSAPQTCLLLPKEGPGLAGTCLPTSAPIQNKEKFPREMRTQMIT